MKHICEQLKHFCRFAKDLCFKPNLATDSGLISYDCGACRLPFCAVEADCGVEIRQAGCPASWRTQP